MTETGIHTSHDTEDFMSTSEEFAIVERVARIVSSVHGAKPDYTRLAAELEQAISFDVFGIVLLRHDHQAVRVTACHRDDAVRSANALQGWIVRHHQHPCTDSMLEHVLTSPMLVVREYPDGLDGPPGASGDALSGYHQLHSTCIVPLSTKERILGTLELGSTGLSTYSDSKVQRLISAVAQVLATAIEGVQLGGSAEIQNRQREVLKDVSTALASKMDLTTILEHLVVGVARSLNVASALVTLNYAERRLHLETQSGLNTAALRSLLRSEDVLSEQCILGRTLLHRRPCISNDIEVDAHFPASHLFAAQLNVRSVLCYPLVTGTTVYGALLLCSPEPGGFTPLKIDILALFASQATIAIHNGMLLESARQRRRFQEAIEKLEHMPSTLSTTRQEEEEQMLLARVREEAQCTFGVSLTSILRFISDNLLTHNERNLQSLLHGYQRTYYSGQQENMRENYTELVPVSSASSTRKDDEPLGDPLLMLTQTAEEALARANILSDLSRLLIQLKQPTSGVKDAWFVADLTGTCIYMNPVAESFCNIYSCDRKNMSMTMEQVFAGLLPRIRNAQEVRHYLQDFTSGNPYRQELRCTLALEPLFSRSTGNRTEEEEPDKGAKRSSVKNAGEAQRGSRSSVRLENAPSDSYHQFTRYSLSNQQGQLTAYALQVRNITMQVLEEKNKAALLSSVSHDLRTPLTTIKAAVTGLLQEDVPWDEQMRREMLEDIDSETDRLTVLVNALVEMSRIEMGALILEKEWCDSVEVLHSVLGKVKRTLANRFVCTRIQSSLPLVYVDRVQIERVLYNLVENAVRHSSEEAELTVILDTVEDTPESKLLRVQVIDKGNSIPEHERERIFKSFYGLRAYDSGLGLAICKGIIEAHQGNIWVEAVTHGGSCFVFTLPAYSTRSIQVEQMEL